MSDEEFKFQIGKQLDNIIKQSDVLLHANHSREILKRSCNRFIVLDEGAIVADSCSRDVLDEYF